MRADVGCMNVSVIRTRYTPNKSDIEQKKAPDLGAFLYNENPQFDWGFCMDFTGRWFADTYAKRLISRIKTLRGNKKR